jgi:hypothetical protein
VNEELKPISVSQGSGWAQSRVVGKATPVRRGIRMVALDDRWLMLTDSTPYRVETTILLAQGPQATSQQLSQAIRKRVQEWGVAVSNGYWKPQITVEVAPNATRSLDRLVRMLEGSGVELQLAALSTQTQIR